METVSSCEGQHTHRYFSVPASEYICEQKDKCVMFAEVLLQQRHTFSGSDPSAMEARREQFSALAPTSRGANSSSCSRERRRHETRSSVSTQVLDPAAFSQQVAAVSKRAVSKRCKGVTNGTKSAHMQHPAVRHDGGGQVKCFAIALIAC
jgi:hypothetical protein